MTSENNASVERSASFNQGSLLDQADQVNNPQLAEDLRFCFQVATGLQQAGGEALVVGGYVRDLILSQIKGGVSEPKDLDFEVYGVDYTELQSALSHYGNVNVVGASFSVAKLLNPHTGSSIDFSVPRSDQSIGLGHADIEATTDKAMTLEHAARRRDLTINALALDPITGELLDPFGGMADLKAGVLRAVDLEQFPEDPLRVLRVMQFVGRLDFTVDPATLELCKTIDISGLSPERIGEEWFKLLTLSQQPSGGLEFARQAGILKKLHPELDLLDKTEQDSGWHPEGNVWNHTKLVTDAAAHIVREEGLSGEEALVVLLGALCHDLGKPATTQVKEVRGEFRTTAYAHETAGIEPAHKFLKQLKVGGHIVGQILPIIRYHLFSHTNPNATDKSLLKLASNLQPANIRLWELVCRSDANGKGEPYRSRTASYPLYRRALELSVAEKPVEKIVQGRDLIDDLGLEPGSNFKYILRFLYEAQLEGHITTVAEGIAYYRAHENQIAKIIAGIKK